MAEYQITAVHRGENGVEHITEVRLAGDSQNYTVSQIINWIRQGHRFFTQVGRTRAYVEIYTRLGREYLRTENDGTTADNLLSLPTF